MRALIGCLLPVVAIGLLAGCDRPVASGEGPAPVSVAASSSAASVADPDGPSPEYVAGRFADEAKAMALIPDMATRQGDQLTIRYDGKPVAEFTGANALWAFAGTIDLTDPDGRHEHLAVVETDDNESSTSGIVRRNGSVVILDGTIKASPDGRWIASGDGDTQYASKLHLVAWAGDAAPTVATFDANCAPTHWQGNLRFDTECTREEDDGIGTVAIVTRAGEGWTLNETRKVAWGTPDTETLSDLPLRHLEGRIEPVKIEGLPLTGYRRITQ